MTKKVSFQWIQDESIFKEEYPTFLEPIGVTKDEVNEILEILSEEFLKLDLQKLLFKRVLRFTTLSFSGFLTIITALLVWLLIFFKTSLYLFLALFLSFICGEVILFLFGVVILSYLIDKFIERRYKNIEGPLNEQINSKYKEKGIVFTLSFVYEFPNIIPKLDLSVFNIKDPWKVYPSIHL